ncbi:phospholipase D-like domain-containing protein [Pseudophaeobacter sp.]|uniref:phospholipase D-like domain-containing protein n=1 Tax=Pseudophaeobacter sp. TaxID=1971739 RepID=UPI00260CC24B|nr:phospholipase D-like domain-containing protein [Pseudophaeobacter sp.]
MHPARVGLLPCLTLWPRTYQELRKTVARVNRLSSAKHERFLEETSFLRRHLQVKDGAVRARIWPIPRLIPATHHQKLAVFDGQQLYIGGLDLNDRRYDTPEHHQDAAETWHDLQVSLSAPEAEDALAHLHSFEAVTRGAPPPKLTHLLRTLSRRRTRSTFALSPEPCVDELAQAHWQGAIDAQTLIYMESQYFRDRRFARHLAAQARSKPNLRMMLILPAAPDDVAFEDDPGSDARYGEYLQANSVAIIREAFGHRLFIGSPAQQRPSREGGRAALYGAPLIYLHAKVSIFDQSSAIVSSANLNGRSLSWDTEAGVELSDLAHVHVLRQRCFDHWLGAGSDDAHFDIDTAQPLWAARARQNAQTSPADRTGFLLPYVSRAARRFGRNLPGIPEEMV